MRHSAAMTDMAALMAGTEEDIARVLTGAAEDNTAATRRDWQDQVRGAGLGQRLANTIRGRTYPDAGSSLDPASWIFTKAPVLIDAYDRGPTILPTDGRFYVAIPTKNVPRKGRRRMSPLDVETSFNQDLIIIKRGRSLLAFVDVALGRFSRSQGAAYGKRKQVRRGKPKLVLMFVLVRSVKVKKRLDTDGVAARAQARFPALLAARWSGMPDRTAPLRSR